MVGGRGRGVVVTVAGLGHRVPPRRTERSTAGEAPHGEPQAAPIAVDEQRLTGVRRARGREPARRGATLEGSLVPVDEADQTPAVGPTTRRVERATWFAPSRTRSARRGHLAAHMDVGQQRHHLVPDLIERTFGDRRTYTDEQVPVVERATSSGLPEHGAEAAASPVAHDGRPDGPTNRERQTTGDDRRVVDVAAPQGAGPGAAAIAVQSLEVAPLVDPADQADSRARPLSRRALMMERPARVRIRARNPCLRARRRVFGW